MGLRMVAPMLVLLATPAARAGVTLIVQKKGDAGGKPNAVYLDADRMRLEDGQKILIFDAAKQTLVGVNPADRTYEVMTADDAKQAAAQMRKLMESMPPEQRKQMEKLAPGAGKPHKTEQIKLVPIGGKKTVAGYTCDQYRVIVDGKPSEEGCYIPWSEKVVTRADMAVFDRFGEFFSGAFGAAARGGVSERIARYPGLPAVRTPIEPDGSMGPEEQLVSVKRGPLPAELFAPPVGYTRKASPGFRAR
jgi:hypothetical protein